MADRVHPSAQNPRPARSERSRAFESLWRSLPRQSLVPPRRAFDPGKAREFLPHLAIVEKPSRENPGLRFRLVGQSLTETIGLNVTGADYLAFLVPEQRGEALAAAHLICEHPCGIWQLNPIYYANGSSRYIEATIFPLGPGDDELPLMLLCFEFVEHKSVERNPADKAVSVETSKIFEFIDIGAGIPSLPGEPAARPRWSLKNIFSKREYRQNGR
jgi:hypothetical protein